jgi:hypothetical protein
MKIGNPFHGFTLRRALSLYFPAATLAIILSSFPLHAQVLVRPVNLVYLAQRADVIVHGIVMDVVQESLPEYPNIPTVKVTLEVKSMLRGPAGDTYTFREVFLGLRAKTGGKSYRVGQELLLFLPIPSKYGLSSPVGNEQGRFHITRNRAGDPVVVNESGNIGLFKNVAEVSSIAGKPLTESQLRATAADRGPVQLDEFVSLLQNLMLTPRIR